MTCQDLVVRELVFFSRHEDFNRSVFDLKQLLLECSGLGYSYYVFNQNYDKIHERDWLSQAGRFDSVRVMLIIGRCNRTD